MNLNISNWSYKCTSAEAEECWDDKRMIPRQIPTLVQSMNFGDVEIMKIIIKFMNTSRASWKKTKYKTDCVLVDPNGWHFYKFLSLNFCTKIGIAIFLVENWVTAKDNRDEKHWSQNQTWNCPSLKCSLHIWGLKNENISVQAKSINSRPHYN